MTHVGQKAALGQRGILCQRSAVFELFVELLYFQLARFDFSDVSHHDHHTHHFSVCNVWNVLHHQVAKRTIRQGKGALKALPFSGKRRFKPRLIVFKQHRPE